MNGCNEFSEGDLKAFPTHSMASSSGMAQFSIITLKSCYHCTQENKSLTTSMWPVSLISLAKHI